MVRVRCLGVRGLRIGGGVLAMAAGAVMRMHAAALVEEWRVAPGGVPTHASMYVALDNLQRVFLLSAGYRVYVLNVHGETIAAWGAIGREGGAFEGASAVAVDDEGSVYIADCGNHRVQKLTWDGVPIHEWGREIAGGEWEPFYLAVNGEGDVCVGERSGLRLRWFDRHGSEILSLEATQLGISQIVGLARNATGDVVVLDRAGLLTTCARDGSRAPSQIALVSADGGPWLAANTAVAVDRHGLIYTRSGVQTINVYSPAGVHILEWTDSVQGSKMRDGGLAAEFPSIYLTDSSLGALLKYRLHTAPSDIVSDAPAAVFK